MSMTRPLARQIKYNEDESVKDALDTRLPEIENYAVLRAYTGPRTDFYVQGYASKLDGGAGVFRVDAGDATSTDNGGTILVDASGRRWKREFSGAVNVRWFGVIGGGADETSKLISALALGRRVVIPDDMTVTASAFTVPQYSALVAGGERSGLALTGSITLSSNTKLIGLNIIGGTFNAVTWSGENNVSVEGCTISLTAATYRAIFASGANTKCNIRNNSITAGGRAIDFTGSHSEIYGNHIYECGNLDACILVFGNASSQSRRIDVCSNVITDSVGTGHGIQIYGGNADAVTTDSFVYYVSEVTISGNHISNLTGAGIWTSIAQNVIVSKNEMSEVIMEGIDFEGSNNCTAVGNTLLNCGAGFGAIAAFHGSFSCSYIGNTIRFEGRNTAFTSGTHHTTVGVLGTSNRNASSMWGYFRDDCTDIHVEGNMVSNDSLTMVTELMTWKGGSANHSTRGVKGLVVTNNTIKNGVFAVLPECDDIEITDNTLTLTWDIVIPIQVQRCTNSKVCRNKVKCEVTSAATGIHQGAIRVGQYATGPQRTTGAVIEDNEVIGYPSTGITVDTFFAGSGNPDGSSFSIRGNKCHNIYRNITGMQRIVEQNYRPDTFAAATEIAS